MELAELLQWLSGAQKTGTLHVDSGSVRKQIVFRDGRIISSSSSEPREHLGEILVGHGLVSEQELRHAVELQKSKKMLLGKILVTIGAVGQDDLKRMLRHKAEESIYDVFAWREGEFKFLDGELPPPETLVPMSLDVAAVVLEGMQRFDEWQRIREVIPSLQAVPVKVAEFDRSALREWDAQVLALVDDDRSIEEIYQLAHVTEFQVSQSLFRQQQAGRLKIVRPRGASAGAPAPAAAPSPVSLTGDDLIGRARELLADKDLESALRHARAAKALDPEKRKVATEAAKIEDEIRHELESSGMRPQDIPELARPLEELAKQQLSPQEGFLLSRLDGRQPVGALVKLGPLPPLDMQLLFHRMLKNGHLRVRGGR